MPQFAYTARTPEGRSRNGTADADSPSALIDQLREQGYLVLQVRPVGGGGLGSLSISLNPFAYLPPRRIDVEQGLHQIAVMLRSGLTLLAALRTAGEQGDRPSVRRLWASTAERIQQGASLTDAFDAHRRIPRLAVDLVRVGEQTGTLDVVMARAAETLERRRHLRTSLMTALMYPTIVLVAALGVTAFMLLVVIPRLETFLDALGRDLPALTQMLLDISATLHHHAPIVLVGTVTAGLMFVILYRWEPARVPIDHVLLRVPVIGKLLRTAITASFARTLGTLIGSGLTLLESLRTAEQQQVNRYVAKRVAEARDRVMQGGTLAETLGEGHAFLPMLPRMVAVGEASGTLDETLGEVARFHEAQLQSAIRQFSAIVEPVIIVVVGGIVGFVYISFFLAMFAAAGAA